MIPIGDYLRTRTTPYVNWALIGINVAVFLYIWRFVSEADKFFVDWGFIPACIGDYLGFNTGAPVRELQAFCPPGSRELVQPFTAMFVHAGWAHILGNMLFLWIFGDNVEDAMGHARYLVFYLICGLVAAAAQTAFALGEVVPAVGASGAIAGVLGAYLVMYPKAMVRVIIIPLFFFPFFIPAVVLIGIWFLTQVFSGIATIGNATAGTGIAWWAHIGGFIAGAVLIWVFRKRQRQRPAYRTWSGGDTG